MMRLPWWSDGAVVEQRVAELVLPTGSIVACDPLVFMGDARPFATTVAPGTYPVHLGVVEGQVAYAALVLGEGAIAAWRPALHPGEAEPGNPRRAPAYPVDAGTGCFIDATTARAWVDDEARFQASIVTRIRAEGINFKDASAWQAAYQRHRQARPTLLERLRAAGYDHGHCAAIAIEGADGGNLVAFSSGGGDGHYPSYWGVDDAGAPVVLVTDFGLLSVDEDEDEEEKDEVEDVESEDEELDEDEGEGDDEEDDDEEDDEEDDEDDDEDDDDAGPAAQPSGAAPLVMFAAALLDHLIAAGLIVLAGAARRDDVVDDLADYFADGVGASSPSVLAEWLSEHAAIDDVFATDDEIGEALLRSAHLLQRS